MHTPASQPANPARSLLVPLTLPDDVRPGAEQMGSKAANLARAASAGLPVPPGFAVTVDAYADPDRLAAVLPAAVAALGPGRLAVRSSAVAEDLHGASYAGQYDTILGVDPGQLAAAVGRIHASAASAQVSAYQRQHPNAELPGGPAEDDPPATGGMAVLVQRMLEPAAAGVAFTANPVTGARDETVVTAVAGLGEQLVAGQAAGDEWIVRGALATRTRQATPEAQVIDAGQARRIAALARQAEALFGAPQDIEWAIQDGTVWLLQARPMTALPDPVTWIPPRPGFWLRNLRLGEWLPDPMTPLFADWLRPTIEAGFHHGMRATAGAVLPFRSAAINGWYYTSPNPNPHAILPALLATRGRILRFMWAALIAPFRDPATADALLLGELADRWRSDLLPRYQQLVATGAREADTAPPIRLRALVEEIAHVAGEHLWSLAVVGGAAWKMEAALVRFHRRHLAHQPGNGHDGAPASAEAVRLLLAGLPGTEPDLPAHAVHSLDPVHPTAGELGWRPDQAGGGAQHRRLAAQRQAATQDYLAALAGDQRRQAGFASLLAVTQRYTVLREEQARTLTLGWPLLRRCLLRLGQTLAADGIIDQSEDVFFLTRAEIDTHVPLGEVVGGRRAAWARQRRLPAPLTIGAPSKLLTRVLHAGQDPANASKAPAGSLVGEPASPGTATGTVRVITDPADFDAFQPGEVLVARATAPAWTPLFAKAAAVVTDAGTLAAHASLVAREYAIPAVVGTGDATIRLRTGQVVTVDGTTGQVHPRS
jgi:phosphohistidine swiveling domain-containing protein